LPISEHPSFARPPITTRLWRYTDLPKFVDLLTTQRLWLTNLEVLAVDDPYEGAPWALRFPHRMWNHIDKVPEVLKKQIIQIYGKKSDTSSEQAFRSWYMIQEQQCIMEESGRRDFYVSCWHAADHESVAMWKIYGSPGAGVAVVTNGARMGAAIDKSPKQYYLGAVRYVEPSALAIGMSNAFDPVLVKRANYQYEQEVRLVHWDTEDIHDALANFTWNEDTMRCENLIEDARPLIPGVHVDCEIGTLIERVIVSPFAPKWYKPMLMELRDKLNFNFEIDESKLLSPAPVPS